MTETFGGSFWCPLPQSDLSSRWSKFLSFDSFHPGLIEARHVLCWAWAGLGHRNGAERFLLFRVLLV